MLLITRQRGKEFMYGQMETPLENTFTMTGWFNYSGDAGFRQSYLHNLTSDWNTCQTRLVTQVTKQYHNVSKECLSVWRCAHCLLRLIKLNLQHICMNLAWNLLYWTCPSTHLERKQVLESTCSLLSLLMMLYSVSLFRMESTEKCDAVISHFNGKFIKTPAGVPGKTYIWLSYICWHTLHKLKRKVKMI